MIGLDFRSTTAEEEKAPTSKSENGRKMRNLISEIYSLLQGVSLENVQTIGLNEKFN